jgi:CIC family chloride channel protein
MSHLRRRSGDMPEWFVRLDRFWTRETAAVTFLALVTGLGAGLGAIAFVEVTRFLSQLFFEGGPNGLGLLDRAFVVVLPALGGLVVGLILHFPARHTRGRGIPEVLVAIRSRNGHLRPVIVLSQAIGSALAIGTGGSAGREGPVVQIGALVGSRVGKIFTLDGDWVIHLAAGGATGGIAVLFNAPLAGMAFALEVVLGSFGAETFPTILISSIAATALSRAVLGDSPAFALPAYGLESWWELLLYLGLGAIAGLGASAIVKALELTEKVFDASKLPRILKPAVGGLGLGVLGFFIPQVFGLGFDSIAKIVNGEIVFSVLLMILVGKILATSLTLGSGSPGGVMAPALFLGAALGGAYGTIVHSLLPDITASSGAYAMIGMAAVFAAAARAPVTASLLLFEMTHDTRVFAPLILAVVVSTIVARAFEADSLYTLNLGLGQRRLPGDSKTTPGNGHDQEDSREGDDDGHPDVPE